MITQFTVACSRTINLGNFESVRVEGSIVTSVDVLNGDSEGYLQEMKDNAQKELRKLLEETYRHQYLDRKKIA